MDALTHLDDLFCPVQNQHDVSMMEIRWSSERPLKNGPFAAAINSQRRAQNGRPPLLAPTTWINLQLKHYQNAFRAKILHKIALMIHKL